MGPWPKSQITLHTPHTHLLPLALATTPPQIQSIKCKKGAARRPHGRVPGVGLGEGGAALQGRRQRRLLPHLRRAGECQFLGCLHLCGWWGRGDGYAFAVFAFAVLEYTSINSQASTQPNRTLSLFLCRRTRRRSWRRTSSTPTTSSRGRTFTTRFVCDAGYGSAALASLWVWMVVGFEKGAGVVAAYADPPQ